MAHNLTIIDEAFSAPSVDYAKTYIVLAKNCIKTTEADNSGKVLMAKSILKKDPALLKKFGKKLDDAKPEEILVKPPKTFEEQYNLLKKRGLIIDDKNKCIKKLSELNYYRFTGYLLPYKKSDMFC